MLFCQRGLSRQGSARGILAPFSQAVNLLWCGREQHHRRQHRAVHRVPLVPSSQPLRCSLVGTGIPCSVPDSTRSHHSAWGNRAVCEGPPEPPVPQQCPGSLSMPRAPAATCGSFQPSQPNLPEPTVPSGAQTWLCLITEGCGWSQGGFPVHGREG